MTSAFFTGTRHAIVTVERRRHHQGLGRGLPAGLRGARTTRGSRRDTRVVDDGRLTATTRRTASHPRSHDGSELTVEPARARHGVSSVPTARRSDPRARSCSFRRARADPLWPPRSGLLRRVLALRRPAGDRQPRSRRAYLERCDRQAGCRLQRNTAVQDAQFSPDDRWLITAASSRALGRPRTRARPAPRWPRRDSNAVTFDPTGRHLHGRHRRHGAAVCVPDMRRHRRSARAGGQPPRGDAPRDLGGRADHTSGDRAG